MAIVKLDNFNADYIMQNQSIFKMGAENPELKITGTTLLSLHRSCKKQNIQHNNHSFANTRNR